VGGNFPPPIAPLDVLRKSRIKLRKFDVEEHLSRVNQLTLFYAEFTQNLRMILRIYAILTQYLRMIPSTYAQVLSKVFGIRLWYYLRMILWIYT
jgi:hypothetical protein